MNTFFLTFFLPPIIVGICVTAFLLIALIIANKKSKLSLRSYAIGFGVCVGINIFAIVISMGFLGAHSFIVLCGPLMIFGFMLTKQLIKRKMLHNSVINFICKSLIIILVWFMAFFPFSLFGAAKIVNLPKEKAAKQELLQIQNEILNYETYADLTPFGLGLYKLKNEGDRNLWDVTKPEDYVIEYEGVAMVYENHFNRRDEETWDNAWDNSNVGKDVIYEVYFYEGTYIIVTPLWELSNLKDNTPVFEDPALVERIAGPDKSEITYYYRRYIYLCKDIAKDVDFFDVDIRDPEVVGKLQELPVEKISRKELSEKLGKDY